MLQLDSCRLNLAGEDIVEVLVWIGEVVALQRFQATNLVKPDYASLVKCYEELATRP